jgi:hypothetical protein
MACSLLPVTAALKGSKFIDKFPKVMIAISNTHNTTTINLEQKTEQFYFSQSIISVYSLTKKPLWKLQKRKDEKQNKTKDLTVEEEKPVIVIETITRKKQVHITIF